MKKLKIFETKLKKNVKYKLCNLILIILIIYSESNIVYRNRNLNINNSLESYLTKYFCKIFIFEKNYDCKREIFNNDNFFYDVKSVTKNKHLLITLKNKKIINLFLLLARIPFFGADSKLIYKINEKTFLSMLKNNSGEIINNNLINLKKEYFQKEKNELINLLDYEWEIIPSRNIINFLRYIINNFYSEDCLTSFDTSLNKNYNKYLEKNINNISLKSKVELISKKYI